MLCMHNIQAQSFVLDNKASVMLYLCYSHLVVKHLYQQALHFQIVIASFILVHIVLIRDALLQSHGCLYISLTLKELH